MLNRALSRLAGVLIVICFVASVGGPLAGQARPPETSAAARGEWVRYAADMRGTRYMPLDQINASNFSKLEIAWRFSTANLGPRPEFNLQGTPLMVGGKLYATGGGGNRRAIVAIDARDRRAAVEARPRRGRACRRGAAQAFRAAACRTGPMAAATSASSTSRSAIGSSRSMPRPASRFPRLARTASSISKSAS